MTMSDNPNRSKRGIVIRQPSGGKNHNRRAASKARASQEGNHRRHRRGIIFALFICRYPRHHQLQAGDPRLALGFPHFVANSILRPLLIWYLTIIYHKNTTISIQKTAGGLAVRPGVKLRKRRARSLSPLRFGGYADADGMAFRLLLPICKINTTLMVITSPSPLIDETIAVYTYAYQTRPKVGRVAHHLWWESACNNGITLYYKMAKNIKNDKPKPFPGNFNAAMSVRRKIGVFRPQISRRMLAIRACGRDVCPGCLDTQATA
ncbi:MAG: hypothetical protein PHR28_08980 [candidate division Zixibacteria bacterium]|nr:hypothetical protein [candidate division Zixibacteria bacterium]